MIDNEGADLFLKIRNVHIRIEKTIQSASNRISSGVCARCIDNCCKAEICKESAGSSFLRFILDKKIELYNDKEGWYNKQTGCTAEYGRPFICYEYFCSEFDNNVSVKNLKQYAHLFKKIYSRIYKGQHIIVVENIEDINKNKLKRILNDLINLEQELLLAYKGI